MTKRLFSLLFAIMLLTASGLGSAYAQTSSSSSNASTTPGVPSTGDGGNAFGNVAILLSSGLVALTGVVYLARSRSVKGV